MWHLFHVIARPVEALLGLFCVLTAIVLYPDEEGKIQSKLEDFWIRVDDYQKLALSKHAAFMTGVSQLESRFLDRIFGPKLISEQALGVSFCCSMVSVSFAVFLSGFDPESFFYHDWLALLVCLELIALSLAVGATSILVSRRTWTRRILIIVLVVGFSLQVTHNREPKDADYILFQFGFVIFGGFACDVGFIALTRRLLRWALQMTSFARVSAIVLLNVILAMAMISPLAPSIFLDANRIDQYSHSRFDASDAIALLAELGVSNFFDVAIALLFVLLAFVLLVHRLAWPLLTRTLFRMADIGTKGRRAILTAVGLPLLSASVFGGKVPELVKDFIKTFGG